MYATAAISFDFDRQIELYGVTIDVTGTVNTGEEGDNDSPGHGAEVTNWDAITAGGVDVTGFIEKLNAYDDLERLVLAKLELA